MDLASVVTIKRVSLGGAYVPASGRVRFFAAPGIAVGDVVMTTQPRLKVQVTEVRRCPEGDVCCFARVLP